MTNGARTPQGKAKKGQVTVRLDSGSVKACFSRTYFADGRQLKLVTGINPDNREAMATKLQRRLQIELEDGKLSIDGIFNQDRYKEILEDYGFRAKFRVISGGKTSSDEIPPKTQLSLLEIWDMYCEYRKPELRESTYVRIYQQQFRHFISFQILL